MEKNGTRNNSLTMESEITHNFPWTRYLQAVPVQAQGHPEFWKKNVAISENQVTQLMTSLTTCMHFGTVFKSVELPMPHLHMECIRTPRGAHWEGHIPAPPRSGPRSTCFRQESTPGTTLLLTKASRRAETRPLCSCYSKAQVTVTNTESAARWARPWALTHGRKQLPKNQPLSFSPENGHTRWPLTIPSSI